MITHVQISNLGGFPALDITLPAVALIEGANGTGKTSLLDALRYLADRGHDPDIIYAGADAGEVVATLENGDQVRARASRASKETTRSWRPADGKRWIFNRELIDKLCSAISYDPVRFLERNPDEQAEILLKLAPINVTYQEIEAAVGDASAEAADASINREMSGLDIINAVFQHLYNARRRLNTVADTQSKHAAQLEKALRPALADGTEWAEEASRIRREIDVKTAELQKATTGLEEAYRTMKSGMEAQEAGEYAEVDQIANAKIAELEKEIERERAWRAERREAIAASTRGMIVTLQRELTDRKSELQSQAAEPLSTIQVALATAQERARVEAEALGTRKAIDAAKAEADAAKGRSTVLTAALTRLETLKLDLASRLPIPGVRVEDGRIVRLEGDALVPLSRWNTADQITLCLKIGMMIGGGLVCVDHCEAFDAPHRERLIGAARRYAEEKGVQFILASVDAAGGPFRVADGAAAL